MMHLKFSIEGATQEMNGLRAQLLAGPDVRVRLTLGDAEEVVGRLGPDHALSTEFVQGRLRLDFNADKIYGDDGEPPGGGERPYMVLYRMHGHKGGAATVIVRASSCTGAADAFRRACGDGHFIEEIRPATSADIYGDDEPPREGHVDVEVERGSHPAATP